MIITRQSLPTIIQLKSRSSTLVNIIPYIMFYAVIKKEIKWFIKSISKVHDSLKNFETAPQFSRHLSINSITGIC